MFVPGGWWHAVLNLDTTIAITENVCNHGNFDRVWYQTRRQRRKFAYKWLKVLRQNERELYNRALVMNKRDLWEMWTPDQKASEAKSKNRHSSTGSSSSSVSSGDDQMALEDLRLKQRNNKDLLNSIDDPCLKQLFEMTANKSYEQEVEFLNYIIKCKCIPPTLYHQYYYIENIELAKPEVKADSAKREKFV